LKAKLKYIILGLVLTLFSIHIFINHDRILIDGWSGEIWSVLRWPDTKYSNGYSHKGFNEVYIGMTENEVLDILGEPIVRWFPFDKRGPEEKKNWVSFQYSESPGDTHYRLRQVLFNEKGIVTSKTGYFCVD
jgi:hypothetical protein